MFCFSLAVGEKPDSLPAFTVELDGFSLTVTTSHQKKSVNQQSALKPK
jgi:hypothetical protein